VVWDRLPPIVGDELLSQFSGRDPKPPTRVITPLYADVGDAQQQGVLVGGDETALGQQPLDVQ